MITYVLSTIVCAVLVCIAVVSGHTTCGDGYCDCYRRTANCTNRGLTFIPRIPPYVRYLYLSQNNFTSLSGTSFVNVSVAFIMNLYLDNSNVSRLSLNSFQNFTQLQMLNLANNQINSADLMNALTHAKFPNMRVLNLNWLSLNDTHFMKNMNCLNLRRLIMDGNYVHVYDHSVFSRFKNLISVSMNDNQLHKIHLTYSKTLRVLSFQGNRLTYTSLPNFCNGTAPLLPNLEQLFLNQNLITKIDGVFKCLPKLQKLKVGRNPIKVLKNNTFSKLTNLKTLLLRSMSRLRRLMAHSFNSSKLEYLILSNNHIDFGRNVHPLSFTGLTNLKVLTLSVNQFQYASDKGMIELFGHLHLLETISMGGCSLTKLPKFLSKLKSLKSISLYRNLIPTIPDNSFQDLTRLTRLSLDENMISTFSEKTLRPSTRKHLTQLDLDKNPFVCDCSLKWFIAWYKKKVGLFYRNDTHYICSGPGNKKGQQLKDIRFSANECYLPFSAIISVLGVSALIIAVVLICSVLYKMRWNIRHVIYMRYHRVQQEEEQLNANMRNYTYDAYVIHSEEDEDWVVDEMIPCLENNHHLRLCVANRDFQPGMYILANIDIAIQTSRNIIVVLSPSFVESEWCQTEVTLAQSFVLDARRRPLLTVVLEEPDARNMRHSLHHLLRSSAYIMWGKEQEARRLFWRRLVESLG